MVINTVLEIEYHSNIHFFKVSACNLIPEQEGIENMDALKSIILISKYLVYLR